MELEMGELRRILKEAEDKLILSAKHGKDLLEENIELKNRFLADNGSSLAKVEALEQERYSLKNRLEACQKSEEALRDEVEATREQCSKEVSVRTEELTKENAKLAQRIRELEDELEERENSRTDLQGRLNELLVKTESLSAENAAACMRDKSAFASDIERWRQLEQEIWDTKQKEALLIETIEAKDKEMEAKDKETKLNEDHLRNTIAVLEDRLVDKEIKLADYINTSEKYRGEITDLQMEIQAARMLETDPNRRGNSLFSEVEDHRRRLEMHLKSLRTKYDSLRSENERNLSRIGLLQKQMAGIAAAASSKVSASHVESLEQKLAQLQHEVKTRVSREDAYRKASPTSVETSRNKNEDQFSYLKVMLHQAQSKSEQLEKELKLVQIKWLTECEQERLVRHNLIKAEQRAEAVWAENMRLKAELNELQSKCGEYKENETVKVIEKINVSGENNKCGTTHQIANGGQSSEKGHLKDRTIGFRESIVNNMANSSGTAKTKPLNSKKCVPLNTVSITKESNECNQQ